MTLFRWLLRRLIPASAPVPRTPLYPLSWTCMICHEERPDAVVGVAHRKLAGFEDAFPATRVNVRYCVDRPDCVAAAKAPGPWSSR